MRCLILLLISVAVPAFGAERTLTVTDVDGVRVEGPFVVSVMAGRGTSGRLSGDARALDHVRVDVEGGTAVIRATDDASDDTTPVKVMLVTRALARASLAGSGALKIDRLAGPETHVTLDGSGTLSVAAV